MTDLIDCLAVSGAPAHSTNSTVNPAGNGLTGIFDSSVQWSFQDCPALVQQANGTYTAPLADDSAALSGGCDVYFDYTVNGATEIAYGIVPTYLIGTSGGTKVTDYQGGGARDPDVIGASGN